MKVLFVGPINDFSGFAHASRLFLKTLNETEFEVVARPLKYDQMDQGQSVEIEEWQQELMDKTISEGIDIVIQMTTCNIEAQPVPGVLNFLYSFFETDTIPPAWAQKANEFDAVMVPCRMNAQALLRSGVTKPIIGIPVPADRDTYDKEYVPYALGKRGDGRTVFYNICQLSSKKGIDTLLRSYFGAFADCPDEVVLVLKTYINMANRNNGQELETLKAFINQVWQACRIPVEKRPPVVPILGTMTEDELHGLHSMDDSAYVCSSRGEGWGMPVFDALCHGRSVISHNWGGLEQFISDNVAMTYGGSLGLCYDMPHPDPVLFNGTTRWFEPSTGELSHIMRSYHLLKKMADADAFPEGAGNEDEWNKVLSRRANARDMVNQYDYRIVQDQIQKVIQQAWDSFKEHGKIQFAAQEEAIQ